MTKRTLVGVLVLSSALTACDDSPSPPAASLHDAIVMRDAHAVQAHLVAGVDVNAADANGITPLIAATTSGQPEVVRSLLAAGADINGRGPEDGTALIHAIQAQQPEMALFLLEQEGIDLEARESHGSTPLVEAIAFQQMEVVEALLERGADINAPGPVGRSALHVEAPNLDPKMIKWLLERGANPDARDDDGATPLHHAALFLGTVDEFEGIDVESALDLLIESTSDIDAASSHGQTPLHVAALWADPWVIKKLLDAGANPLAMDQAGYSPICYVTAGGQARPRIPAEALAVVSLFRDAGFTDETAIDEHGATLTTLEDSLRKQP